MKSPPPELADRLLSLSDVILRPDPVVKFDELAALVEISRAGLYYYFAGRDDLVSFVLHRHVHEGAAAMEFADPGVGTPALDRLHAVLRAMVDYLEKHSAVCVGLLSSIGEGERLGTVLAANDEFIATPLRDLLQTGIDEGVLQPHRTHDAANAIMGAVLLSIVGRVEQDPQGDANVDADSLITHLVYGLHSSHKNITR